MNSGRQKLEAMTSRATGWRDKLHLLWSEPAHSRILGGSLVMLVGSGLVSTANFGYNVAVAHMLGPQGFGHAAAAVTLLMLASAITLTFQLVCAKLVARSETSGAKVAVFSSLLRRSWLVGIGLGSALFLLSPQVTRYLKLPSSFVVILLAAGVAFYVPLGVKRGGLQGVCAFSRLATNFILEAVVKCLGAVVLIELGFGILGAVAAIAVSVILAYFVPPKPAELQGRPEPGETTSLREGIQAIVFFVGQVIINNIDILLVKHFFPPEVAGLYAAVALVGRVVYMLSWSVVSAMFPLSASAKREDQRISVLVVPLVIVLGIAVVFIAGLGLFPDLALRLVFGSGIKLAGYSLNSLLLLYAASTGVYSLSVVLMAYEMSRKLVNSGYIQLFFSGAIVAGICLFHATLRDVVLVQLVLMVVLFIAAALPFFQSRSRRQGLVVQLAMVPDAIPSGGLTRLRRVPEPEVIAQFLRNEFHHIEFDADRKSFQTLVMHPDTANESENALRRALLFRRRGTMWRELPADTEWWEIEITEAAIEKLRVFPRAQWRKLASGSFLLTDIVSRIRNKTFMGRTRSFLARLNRFSEYLRRSNAVNRVVLLIGIDENQPLTILEGNHRISAAMLVSPELVRQRFQFYCGFSPRMAECCWYETSLATLYRYARNRLKILRYDSEADITRLLHLHYAAREADDAIVPITQETEARNAS
jgi:O-antigen/teichoic acid export membrane protein